MKYVADTNTLLAVALNEPEAPWLIDVTRGCELVAPEVLPFEVGNALSALVKRKTLRPADVPAVWDAVCGVPVELREIDVKAAVALAVRVGIYAYDAYFLQCALETRYPLLTLDQAMRRVAVRMKIKLVEK